MNVLITCTTLAYGGAQSFVRALARGLRRRGHAIAAYTTDFTDAVNDDALIFIRDPAELSFAPDVLHAQHHLDAMTALAALPEVPAIQHSHGAIWKDCVVAHPRIYRYLAMSRTYARRIAIESRIAPEKIETLLNAVELDRFSTVRALPTRPARALFYNRHYRPQSETVKLVHAAAERRGLALDLAGYYFGHTIEAPEKSLPSYDLVFASGLSAIEALACGCAVIVLGRSSCGELVTPENFDRLRAANFSIATNSAPPSLTTIAEQIERYSPEHCAAVTARLRVAADLEKTLDRLLELYAQTIAQHAAASIDARAESLAFAHYFRRLTSIVAITDEVTRDSTFASAELC